MVECRGVSRLFGRGAARVLAVDDVTCQVYGGQRIALTGESGSGKSTLLHLMAGVDAPTAGDVRWPGLPVRAGRPSRVGVVFQAPSLVPALDVTDNVALPLLFGGVEPAEARARALAALARLGLMDLATAAPDALSGGQGQRVVIARVLAGEPSLVLADEPTGQLDHRTAAHVVDVLLESVDELGAALLVSTHDPAVSDRLTERWSMADGQVLHAGAAPVRR